MNSDTNLAKSNLARAKEFFTNINDLDAYTKTLEQLLDDDVRVTPPGSAPEELQHIRGKKEAMALMMQISGVVLVRGTFIIDFVSELANDKLAMFEIRMRAKLAAGGDYDCNYVFFFEFGSSGKVVDFREHADSNLSFKKLGIIE